MKKIFILFVFYFNFFSISAQDLNQLTQQAITYEKQFNEKGALQKYEEILSLKPTDISLLVKCTELSCSIGSRQTLLSDKKKYFDEAEKYALQSFNTDSTSSIANYAQALVYGKLTSIEMENKKIVDYVRLTYVFALRSMILDANNAKASYVLGKWHLEMTNLSWFKRTAVKLFYGGLPEAENDSAILYMEKCKKLDPYFVLNYLDLAKAYIANNQPAEANAVLTKMIHLPNRTADDAALKSEGQKLLEQLQ